MLVKAENFEKSFLVCRLAIFTLCRPRGCPESENSLMTLRCEGVNFLDWRARLNSSLVIPSKTLCWRQCFKSLRIPQMYSAKKTNKITELKSMNILIFEKTSFKPTARFKGFRTLYTGSFPLTILSEWNVRTLYVACTPAGLVLFFKNFLKSCLERHLKSIIIIWPTKNLM